MFPDDIRHFSPWEFDRPEEVDLELLRFLDELRERLGRRINITSDARPLDDGSPHADSAVDFYPTPFDFDTKKKLIKIVLDMHDEGWLEDTLGFEIGTRHFHLDNAQGFRRPHIWGGPTRS